MKRSAKKKNSPRSRFFAILAFLLLVTVGSVAFAQTQQPREVIKSATLDVSMSPQEIRVNQRARVTMVVVNTGNVPVEGIMVIARLPQGFTYNPNSANGSPDLISKTPQINSQGGYQWYFKTMAPGKQSSVWFEVIPGATATGTRCTVGLLDPPGIHGVQDTSCISVLASTASPTPTPKTSPSPTPRTSPSPSSSPRASVSPTPGVTPTPGTTPTPNVTPTPGTNITNTNTNTNTVNIKVLPETGLRELVIFNTVAALVFGYFLSRYGKHKQLMFLHKKYKKKDVKRIAAVALFVFLLVNAYLLTTLNF